MGDIFSLAKTYQDMDPAEIEKLLRNPDQAVRVGAVSIMDFQARAKKTSAERRLHLYTMHYNFGRQHKSLSNPYPRPPLWQRASQITSGPAKRSRRCWTRRLLVAGVGRYGLPDLLV